MPFAAAFTFVPSTGGEVWFALVAGVLVWLAGRFPIVASILGFLKKVLDGANKPTPNSNPLTDPDTIKAILDRLADMLKRQKEEDAYKVKASAVLEVIEKP